MTSKTPKTIEKVYIVANPRGQPAEVNGERIPIFMQTFDGETRIYFEGDIYDWKYPENPLERGWLEVKGG